MRPKWNYFGAIQWGGVISHRKCLTKESIRSEKPFALALTSNWRSPFLQWRGVGRGSLLLISQRTQLGCLGAPCHPFLLDRGDCHDFGSCEAVVAFLLSAHIFRSGVRLRFDDVSGESNGRWEAQNSL
jgi:hypothetical protein